MASLNLSANGPSITKSYQSVIDTSIAELAKGSSTFAKWALFSVSTPLMSAFKQDTGNKESILKVQDTGEGELADLLDEFSEGKIQFSFVKVLDANTGLPKNVLIAWCGEGVPERTKGYFTSHMSTVSKFLHGYHVQITARSDTDLSVEGIIQKVGDASGAKYTPGPERSTNLVAKPPVFSKPAFTPLRTGAINAGTTGVAPLPARVKSHKDDVDDGWGSDAPPVTRTNLEKVQPAYQPTRVNIQEIRSGRQSETTVLTGSATPQQDGIVKGGYQPIGKVDIAAIRRQAREDGSLKDDRPEPVKGAYEPVGKVDIAAIRAKAQKTGEAPTVAGGSSSPGLSDGPSGAATDIDHNQSSRLTSLPKPRVSNRFGGGPTFTGTKPPLPGNNASSVTPTAPVGSASRTFADQGGKTPAQLWAERKAKERGQEPPAVTAAISTTSPTPQSHTSDGGEWQSSYSGKASGPVQTTHTGNSAESGLNDATGSIASDNLPPKLAGTQEDVPNVRDRLTQGPPKEAPSFVETAETNSPVEIGRRDVDIAASPEPQALQDTTSQPQISQSPTPDLAEGERSPIRVAVPVAREVANEDEQQNLTSHDEPAEDMQRKFPHTSDDTDQAQVRGLTTAPAIPDSTVDSPDIRAIVQYDYDKAEDNEVDLREGEYVTEIDMVDKDWWLGLNARGEKGLFPSNYVEVVETDHGRRTEHEMQPTADIHEPSTADLPIPTASTQGNPTAKALYDYEAAEDNELSFPEGAVIKSIEFPDDDWWLGEYGGKTGLFPANYVQLDH